MLRFISPDSPFYLSIGRQKQWLNGPWVPARSYVESNDPSVFSNIIAGKVESAYSNSVFTDHCDYHVNSSSHPCNPNRITSFRGASDNAGSSCWLVEFQCELYTHECENYRHYCESDWDSLFQCQPIQSRDHHDR